MTTPKQDWKRLLEMMGSFLELDEAGRQAWLGQLGATDPKLKSGLLQLLAQHNSLVQQDFLGTPVALGPARSAAPSTDGLSTIVGSRPVIAAYAGQPDDDATIVPWRADAGGPGRTPHEVMRVSGAWLPPGIDESGPEPLHELATPDAPLAGMPSQIDATGVRNSPASIPATPTSDTPARPLQEGDVLDARCTLVAEVGRGGMGTVYKALDANRVAFQDRHPYIALKLLGEEFKLHPDARMALQRETVRAQSLTHENIVRVHDFDYDGTYAYMTMELLQGRTLEDWLQ